MSNNNPSFFRLARAILSLVGAVLIGVAAWKIGIRLIDFVLTLF